MRALLKSLRAQNELGKLRSYEPNFLNAWQAPWPPSPYLAEFAASHQPKPPLVVPQFPTTKTTIPPKPPVSSKPEMRSAATNTDVLSTVELSPLFQALFEDLEESEFREREMIQGQYDEWCSSASAPWEGMKERLRLLAAELAARFTIVGHEEKTREDISSVQKQALDVLKEHEAFLRATTALTWAAPLRGSNPAPAVPKAAAPSANSAPQSWRSEPGPTSSTLPYQTVPSQSPEELAIAPAAELDLFSLQQLIDEEEFWRYRVQLDENLFRLEVPRQVLVDVETAYREQLELAQMETREWVWRQMLREEEARTRFAWHLGAVLEQEGESRWRLELCEEVRADIVATLRWEGIHRIWTVEDAELERRNLARQAAAERALVYY